MNATAAQDPVLYRAGLSQHEAQGALGVREAATRLMLADPALESRLLARVTLLWRITVRVPAPWGEDAFSTRAQPGPAHATAL